MPRLRLLHLPLTPRPWFPAAAVAVCAVAVAQVDPTGGGEPFRNFENFPAALVFFPPVPPPLGRPVSRLAVSAAGRQAAPPELAAYINEVFYPPLSTRLSKNNLSPKLREKLEAYRAAKTRLQAELRTELARLRDAEPGDRRAALEALARRQSAPILQLEQTAEELRTELNSGDTDWSAFRQWRLGGASRGDRGDSPSEVAQVMRATAYYQAGLLPAQRRLLREISLEVAMSAEDEAKAAAAQPFLFFPPEPARVLLPDDIPTDLATLVAQFQTQKSALKKELFDLTYAEDSASFGFIRTNKFKSLATRQAPRLAALEELAEKIRAGLRLLPDHTPPPLRAPLPSTLTERIIAFAARRAAYQSSIRDRLDEIGTQLREIGARLGYQFDNESIKTVAVPGRRGPGLTDFDNTRFTALRAKLTAIETEYRAQVETFTAELNALRHDIGDAIGDTAPERVDAKLNEAATYYVQRENEDGYRDYRVAVFEPGLSPEQRRLLFDGAMEKLSIPLPRGDLQPVRRAATW